MGHHSCCNKQKVRRGLWSPEEDEKLINYITTYGHGCWSSVPRLAGLQRCGKSCRLRWINYLRPDLKRGSFSPQEESMIIELHRMLGNRWAQIAKNLPGRTDNEVKNYWNSSIKKKLLSHGAVELTFPNNLTLGMVSKPDYYDAFSLNSNPNLMFTAPDHLYLPTADCSSTIGASEQEILGLGDLNTVNVINCSSEWADAQGTSAAFDMGSTSSFDYHLQQEEYERAKFYSNEATVPSYYSQPQLVDSSEPRNPIAKFTLPYDSSPSLMMTKLCEIIDIDGCTMPSTPHDVDQDSKLPYLSSSSCSALYDAHIPMNQMDYMDAAMASSSSSSGHVPINPSLPSQWEPYG